MPKREFYNMAGGCEAVYEVMVELVKRRLDKAKSV
jgi:hypothetical protein